MINSDWSQCQGHQGVGEAVANWTVGVWATGTAATRRWLLVATWEWCPALTRLIFQRNLDF